MRDWVSIQKGVNETTGQPSLSYFHVGSETRLGTNPLNYLATGTNTPVYIYVPLEKSAGRNKSAVTPAKVVILPQ